MDSWDDEDYEVPILTEKKKEPKDSWDDEEESDGEKNNHVVKISEKQRQIIEKRKEDNIKKIVAQHKAEMLMVETPEERKLRESRQLEEQKVKQAMDLFSDMTTNSKQQTATGLSGVSLAKAEDYVKLAVDLGEKLNKSDSSDILLLLKELITKVESKLSLESVQQLIRTLNKIEDAKAIAERKKKENLQKQKAAKEKKAKQTEKKKTQETVYGGEFDGFGDKYDDMGIDYAEKYDEFM